MPRWRVCLRTILILAVGAVLLSGCGIWSWWTSPDFKSDLKFKVAVMPFDDMAGVGGSPVEWNTARLVGEELAKNREVIVIPHDRVQDYIVSNNVSLPITQENAPAVGKALGVNAVVIGAMADLSQVQKRKGWRRWFRFVTDRRDYVTAMLVGSLVDVESGTLLGAKVGEGEAPTGQIEDELVMGNPTGGVPQDKIAASVDVAIADLAKNFVQALSMASWKGFIVQADADSAVLNAGEDVGIRNGDQFVSFSPGESITNEAGQTYTIPGPPKAHLEAVDVGANSTRLKIIDGSIMQGDSIQPSLLD